MRERLRREVLDLVERALARATADGVVVVLAPAGGCSRSELRRDLERLGRGMGIEFVWQTVALASEPTLVLAFGRGAAWRERWRSWSRAAVLQSDELMALLAPATTPAELDQLQPESHGLVSARAGE